MAWYRNSSPSHPLKLAASVTFRTPLHSVACFPWNSESFLKLWGGALQNVDNITTAPDWEAMIAQYSDLLAIGGIDRLDVLSIHLGTKATATVHIPNSESSKAGRTVKVAWALNQAIPLEPLVIFSAGSLLYIYNMAEKKIVGIHRGHGGEITSIAVHPIMPHKFCTTSRDYSTRLYDLNSFPLESPKNPCWPPSKSPSLAGAASGIHSVEEEDVGMGRCIAIFVGGLSTFGGHAAAVLGADFHPTLPIVATCGMDRAINIWRIPPTKNNQIAREHRPLFNSPNIHKGRVLSVTWISEDCLLSHCSATFERIPKSSDFKNIPGTLVLFQWHGLNAYFPPEHRHQLPYPMRGTIKDAARSSSYHIVSTYTLPMPEEKDKQLYYSPHLSVFKMASGDPIVIFSSSDTVYMLNVSQFTPNNPPPADTEGEIVNRLAAQLNIEATTAVDNRNVSSIAFQVKANTADEFLYGCSMGLDGRLVVGVGSKLHIWTVSQ